MWQTLPTHKAGTAAIRPSRSIHTFYIFEFPAIYEDDGDMDEYSGLFGNLSITMKLIVLLGLLAVALGKLLSIRTQFSYAYSVNGN